MMEWLFFNTEHWIECNNLSWIDSIDFLFPKWTQRCCPILENSSKNHQYEYSKYYWNEAFCTKHWIECKILSWIDSIVVYLPKWTQRCCQITSKQSEQKHWYEYKKWSWNDYISVSLFIRTKRSCLIWFCHENVAKTDRF